MRTVALRALADEPALSPPSSRPSSPHTSSALSMVAWTPKSELGIAEWSAVGRRLGAIGRCSQWWLGDWIHYGNLRFGERYARAAKLTGYDAQSLMNMVYVATRFPISRRRESLSWSHHATLAALEQDAQEHWLNRAAAQRMSVADLRMELRGRRRALKAVESGDAHAGGKRASAEDSPPTATLVCPTCGGSVPVSH